MYKLKMAHPFERQKALVVKTNENKKKSFKKRIFWDCFTGFQFCPKTAWMGVLFKCR